MQSKNKSIRAFTIIEMSIVIIIIGLILGGIFGGQKIIMNARINNMIGAIQNYQAQYQSYIQNYGTIPGLDAGAKNRFTNLPTSLQTASDQNANNNGLLDSDYKTSDDTSSSRLIWAHLRGAGLVKLGANTGTDISSWTNQASNPFGGSYGFQGGAFSGTRSFTGNVLCMNQIPKTAALAIDTQLDDGAGNSGNILAIQTGGDVSKDKAQAYETDTSYTLCLKL